MLFCIMWTFAALAVTDNGLCTILAPSPLSGAHRLATLVSSPAELLAHAISPADDLVVCLSSGTTTTPLVLNASHNRRDGGRVVWHGASSSSSSSSSSPTILSAGSPLTKWKRCDPVGGGSYCPFPQFNGVWVHFNADVANATAADIPFRVIWVDGVRISRRSTDRATLGGKWLGTATGYTTSEPLGDSSSGWAKNQVELRWPSQVKNWIEPRCVVASVDATQTKITVAPECWAALVARNGGKPPPPPALVENLQDTAPGPGEFTSDPLYTFYRPPASTPYAAPVNSFAPVGSVIMSAHDLQNHTFSNLEFSHATWRIPTAKGGYVPSQSLVTTSGGEPVGGVNVEHSTGIVFTNCTFQNIGAAYALSIGKASHFIQVVKSSFRDLSGGAIKLGNVIDTNCTTTDPSLMDLNYIIEDNTLDEISLEFRGGAAVFAGYVAETNISHNTISNTGYTGISLGWGWGTHVQGPQTFARDNHIVGNHLSGIMSALNDGGCTYTLGPQPRSTVSENYCDADHAPVVGCFYHDNGSRYFNTTNNVAKDSPAPCVYLQGCCNSPAFDIHVEDLWCMNTAPVRNGCAPQDCTIDNATLYIVKAGAAWPKQAQGIVDAAGVRN